MAPRTLQNGLTVATLIGALLMAPVASAQGRRRGGGDGPRGGTAVARPSAPAPAPGPAPATGGTSERGEPATTGAGTTVAGGNSGSRRPDRGGAPVGPAVPRRTPVGPGSGGTVVIVPGGYYPWGYGGFGFGGYYGGFYDPWYGYPDPGYPYPAYGAAVDEGAVRIKVSPRDASVYVDGYDMGIVDDYDGLLQKLHLSVGPHHIEVRDPQYQTLTFDVRIAPDQTITCRGDMRKR